MIVTFTDFGLSDPYLGQVRAVLYARAPGEPVVDLFPELPAFNIQASAYLLPAYSASLPEGSVCLCVVDPGVGSDRRVLALKAEGRWYVGPDNGLLAIVARRASRAVLYAVDWRPPSMSNSFHGRDVFAPICARLANGEGLPDHRPIDLSEIETGWPDDLWEVVYIDRYGNCMTGVRAVSVDAATRLRIAGRECERRRTFSDGPSGELFWYENSNGLVEIALARGNAARECSIGIGTSLGR